MQLELLLLQELLCGRRGGCCKEKWLYKQAHEPRCVLCVQLGMHYVQQAVLTCATQHLPRVQQGMHRVCSETRCASSGACRMCSARTVPSQHPLPSTVGAAMAQASSTIAQQDRGLGRPPRSQRGAGQTQARWGQPLIAPIHVPTPSTSHPSHPTPLRDRPRVLWAGSTSFVCTPKTKPTPEPPGPVHAAPPGARPGRQPTLFSRRFYSHSHSHQISHGPEAPRLQGLH